MNLVAKEFVVQHATRGSGALVLSEFTGAPTELRAAVPCNPFDIEGVAQVIKTVLDSEESTRRHRLTQMARRLHRQDMHRWAGQQLDA
jgi:trehalose 6-phosphate synthase